MSNEGDNNIAEKIGDKIDEIIENVSNAGIETEENVETYPPPVVSEDPLVTQNDYDTPLGILDPEGKGINPFTRQPYQNYYIDVTKKSYANYVKSISALPMYENVNGFIKTIRENQITIISAGTGTGKSTVAILAIAYAVGYIGRIMITIPKRAAVLKAATYVSQLANVQLGEEVGFKYKNSKMPGSSGNSKTINRDGHKSRIIFATDGYLLAKMKSDPLLEEFNVICIDEAHELSISTIELLALIRQILKKRSDLKLVIISATLNAKMFTDYFPSKTFKLALFELSSKSNLPVTEVFLKTAVNKVNKDGVIEKSRNRPPEFISAAVDISVNYIKNNPDKGDVVVFIAGKSDIKDGCMDLATKSKSAGLKTFCGELHAGVTGTEVADLAMSNKLYKNKTGADKKIVFATELASSSLTIEGLTGVVDTGMSKKSIFFPDTGADAILKMYISKAEHTQRKGRVGRTREGDCMNVFTEEEYKQYFPDFPPVSILTADITENVLNYMSLPYVTYCPYPFEYSSKYGNANFDKGMPLDQFLHEIIVVPKLEYVRYAVKMLYALGALESSGANKSKLVLSPLGEAMLTFRMIKPAFTKAILYGHDYLHNSPRHLRDDVIIIASLIEVAEGRFDKLFDQPPKTSKYSKEEARKIMDEYNKARKKNSSKHGDLIAALEAYHTLMDMAYPRDRDQKTEEEKAALTGKARDYAKKHFINFNKFKMARDKVNDHQRELQQAVRKRKDQLYYNKYHAKEMTFEEFHTKVKSGEMQLDNEKLHEVRVFLPEDAHVYPPDESNYHINNVILALFSGLFPNYASSVGKGRYQNLFFEKQSIVGLDRYSFVADMGKQPKHVFYCVF